jgi:hypothetical protein
MEIIDISFVRAEGLLALYAHDAVIESPLMAVFFSGEPGVCRGHEKIQRFLLEATRRRPDDQVRLYRTGKYLSDGKTLVWEYPRETPEGDQVELAEIMDIENGKIQHHRIYWGWFGFAMLQQAREKKA